MVWLCISNTMILPCARQPQPIDWQVTDPTSPLSPLNIFADTINFSLFVPDSNRYQLHLTGSRKSTSRSNHVDQSFVAISKCSFFNPFHVLLLSAVSANSAKLAAAGCYARHHTQGPCSALQCAELVVSKVSAEHAPASPPC